MPAALQVSVIARSTLNAPGAWRCTKNVTLAALTGSVKLPGVPSGPPGVGDGPPGVPGAAPGTSTRALRAAPKSIRWSMLLAGHDDVSAVTVTWSRPGTGVPPLVTRADWVRGLAESSLTIL